MSISPAAPALGDLLDEAERIVHEFPIEALAIAERCEQAAVADGSPEIRARGAYLRARIHAERGELHTALDLIEAARAWWTSSGDRLAALRTDLGRMQVLDDLGRHTETGEVGVALLAELEAFDGSPEQVALSQRLRATALNNLGATCSQVGDHERALELYARAESAYRDLGLDAQIAEPMANRGIGLLALGRARAAVTTLGEAAARFAANGDRIWEAKCGGVLADAHQQLGHLTESLRIMHDAHETLIALDAEAEALRLQLTMARTYLSAGLFAEARTEAEGALNRTAQLGLRHDNGVASYLLALAHLNGREYAQAEHQLDAAAGCFEEIGDRQNWARVLLAQADLAAERGRRLEAATLAAAAADSLHTGSWRIPLAWARLRQADLASSVDSATRLSEVSGLIDELDVPALNFAYQVRLGRMHRRRGEFADAESRLRLALAEAARLGASLHDPGVRTALHATTTDAHDGLVDVLVARGLPDDIAEACRIADAAKARTLIDLVSDTVGARHLPVEGRDTPRSRRLDEIRGDLSATHNAYLTATSTSLRTTLRKRAERLESDARALRIAQDTAEPTPPWWQGDEDADAASPPTPQCDSITLAYHVVDEDLVVFVLYGQDTTVRRLAGVMPAVRHALARLASQWSRFRLGRAFLRRNGSSLLGTVNICLGDLYDLILAPVADLLDGAGTDSLVVVPHRELGQLPFQALHDGTGYLNERWTIIQAPTVASSQAHAGGERREDTPALIIAVPDANAPAIELEARAIADVLRGGELALGAAATTSLLRERLPGPRIVHVACHGLYRPSNPLFSCLRLADRWITAAEILDLDLAGALVTLSACESGRPGSDAAEPVGLAWAFLAAGASGVVASHWVVDDGAAALLMSAMYEHVQAGESAPVALRRAQLQTAAQFPHPYHWAPFVYVASPARTQRRPS